MLRWNPFDASLVNDERTPKFSTMRPAIDVLVIDDSDRDVRTTLSGIRQGSETATVLRLKGVDQAVDYLYRKGAFKDRSPHPPRMILLELELPDASGLVLLDRLQSDAETSSIPVIVLTSIKTPLVTDDAIRRGAKVCVAKPDNRAEYIAVVAQAVGRWLH
jgi:two-component system, response regulator